MDDERDKGDGNYGGGGLCCFWCETMNRGGGILRELTGGVVVYMCVCEVQRGSREEEVVMRG